MSAYSTGFGGSQVTLDQVYNDVEANVTAVAPLQEIYNQLNQASTDPNSVNITYLAAMLNNDYSYYQNLNSSSNPEAAAISQVAGLQSWVNNVATSYDALTLQISEQFPIVVPPPTDANGNPLPGSSGSGLKNSEGMPVSLLNWNFPTNDAYSYSVTFSGETTAYGPYFESPQGSSNSQFAYMAYEAIQNGSYSTVINGVTWDLTYDRSTQMITLTKTVPYSDAASDGSPQISPLPGTNLPQIFKGYLTN